MYKLYNCQQLNCTFNLHCVIYYCMTGTLFTLTETSRKATAAMGYRI